VLERRRFRRVGGTQEIELGARVIAATNRDLRAEVNNNRFRHDLYHRLAVVVLRLPSLRDRREDILPLVRHFARDLGATETIESIFGADALARWERHPWPGNIRELRNAVEAALVVGPTGSYETLPTPSHDPATPLGPYKDARAAVVREFESDYLRRLLADANGNVSQAARAAKMDRSHLIDLLHRHGLKE
jgi:DNA-binding NtrC family response regulator